MKITIKAARVNAGLTITKAAEMLGLSTATLCAYETGKSDMRASTLYKMAELYGVSVDQFLPPVSSDYRKNGGV